ncbi:MAG: hypothetical protein JJ863_21460 [Deltaproteobacteria bacterium]|nr:hypothetical protein [Deltaproteobacteria bacterium]
MNHCLILGIDPAAASGWALMRPAPAPHRIGAVEGGILAHGVARNPLGVVEAVDTALQTAIDLDLPLVALAETWRGHRRKPGPPKEGEKRIDVVQTFAGLGTAWGRWKMLLEAAATPALRERFGLPGRMAKARILRAHVSEWTKALGLPTKMKTEVRRTRTIAWVERRYEIRVSHDEAAALCLCAYGQHAEKVRKSLPGAAA